MTCSFLLVLLPVLGVQRRDGEAMTETLGDLGAEATYYSLARPVRMPEDIVGWSFSELVVF